jgi:hypothetical protein
MNAQDFGNGSPRTAQPKSSARMVGKLGLGGAVLAAVAVARPGQASTISVANYNFASPTLSAGNYTSSITDWTGLQGNSGVQNFQGGTSQFSSTTLAAYNTANGGYQAAYVIAGGSTSPGAIAQDVTTTDGSSWQPNTTYTLTLLMGQRLDEPASIGSMALVSGTLSGSTISNPVVEAANNNLTSTSGNFTSYSIEFTTGVAAPTGDLIIDLGNLTSTGTANQVEFGDVQLTANPVPEPAALSLLAIGGLGLLLKRRRMA